MVQISLSPSVTLISFRRIPENGLNLLNGFEIEADLKLRAAPATLRGLSRRYVLTWSVWRATGVDGVRCRELARGVIAKDPQLTSTENRVDGQDFEAT